MRHFLIHTVSDGRIVRSANRSNDTPPLLDEGEDYVEVPGRIDDYSDLRMGEEGLQQREPLPLPDEATIVADGADELVLTGLPAGTTFSFDLETGTVDDGELVLTAVVPAVYDLIVDPFPYRRHTVRVTANAP